MGAGAAPLYEIVLTAVLMFVIVAFATDARAGGAGAALGACAYELIRAPGRA